MTTLKVKLNCQWDNGREVLPPGTETELDRDQVFALADMGMVEVLIEKKTAEPVKVSTATKPAEAKGRQTKKAKEAKAVATRAAEQEATGGDDSENDSADSDNENQDSENDPGDSDDAIPDPDSLVE